MATLLRIQSHRMEIYAVAALLVALLGFSHMLGYWPHSVAIDRQVRERTTEVSVAGSADSTAASSQKSGGDLQETVWRLVFLVGVLAAGLLFYLGRRVGATGGRPITAKRPPPLVIHSASWGIGGDACKDVTEIVRQHARSDSINIPATTGILGDPYPGSGKYLKVVYSFARQWEVTVPEPQYLVLPEKPGEEQSTKSLQEAKAKIEQLQSPEDKLIAGMSETEYNLFIIADREFRGLPWSQRIALKRICAAGPPYANEFRNSLLADGFADPQKIVEGLKSSKFLEERNGVLQPDISRAKFIDVFLEKYPPC